MSRSASESAVARERELPWMRRPRAGSCACTWVRTWEPGPCMHAPRTPRRATSRAPSAPPRHIVRGPGPASATRGPTRATWRLPRPRARLHALASLRATACMPRSTTASASGRYLGLPAVRCSRIFFIKNLIKNMSE
jgi:hypothetical protein